MRVLLWLPPSVFLIIGIAGCAVSIALAASGLLQA
jgi:hypothetical protein